MQTMTPVRLRVKELREAEGWTQDQLAKISGVNQGTISKIERNKTGGIEFDNLERLARAFNVKAAYLVVQDDEEEEAPPNKPAPPKKKAAKRRK